MSSPVITVENLSKAYRIGLKEEIPDTIVGAMTGWLKAPLRNWKRLRSLDTGRLRDQVSGVKCQVSDDSGNGKPGSSSSSPTPDTRHPTPRSSLTPDPCHLTPDSSLTPDTRHLTPDTSGIIWALRDVSFEVQQGEVLGIIGRNGAGKSTLLKLLSRITEPTSGRAVIRGRISSLLEVGTGFHPELTGRENLYMNGTILGMAKKEIDRKFDEIVDFSGVEKFLDTPVKRYSSGMQVRLAFAVAAHLEPEILVIDEVLAVGDADFQKRCFGKMRDVASQGRTVLIVSHNMGSITSLCPEAMLLEQGRLAASGPSSQVVQRYLGRNSDSGAVADFLGDGRHVGDELAVLLRAWIEDEEGDAIHEVDIRQPFCIKMEYDLLSATPEPPYANIHVLDQRGEYVFCSGGRNCRHSDVPAGRYQAECRIPGNLMNDGCYFIGLALTFTHNGIHVSFFEKDALSITVRDPVLDTVGTIRCGYAGPMPGAVRPRLDWRIERISCPDRSALVS